jgi:hypothetical protein
MSSNRELYSLNLIPGRLESRFRLALLVGSRRGANLAVRTFWMLDKNWQNLLPLLPNSPVTFHGAVDDMPRGCTYTLEVIEAHYVKYLSTNPNGK